MPAERKAPNELHYELFAELQAEAAERGIKLIASDDGTFEPVEGAKCNGKTED
jgi:hypothetical protein